MNTLYFEGAGCVPTKHMENCRVKTMFFNNNGNVVFVEAIGNGRYSDKGLGTITEYLFYDHGEWIYPDGAMEIQLKRFPYTENGLLEIIHLLGGTQYDSIKVVNFENDDYFRVIDDNGNITLGGWY